MHLVAALALKGIDYEYKAVNLVKDGGQQVRSARVQHALCLWQFFYCMAVCVHVAV